jgi:hypothetical protein
LKPTSTDRTPDPRRPDSTDAGQQEHRHPPDSSNAFDPTPQQVSDAEPQQFPVPAVLHEAEHQQADCKQEGKTKFATIARTAMNRRINLARSLKNTEVTLTIQFVESAPTRTSSCALKLRRFPGF